MKTVPISNFVDHLRQMINCPLVPLMEQEIVKSAQEFCRESELVLYYRQFDEVYKGQTINIVERSALNRRLAHSRDDDSPQLKAIKVLKVTSRGEDLTLDRDYHIKGRDEILFLNDFTNVEIVCPIEPSIGAKLLPSMLYDDYQYAICCGALYRLMMQPESTWTDPNKAGYYKREFTEQYREARRFRLNSSPHLFHSNPVRRKEFY